MKVYLYAEIPTRMASFAAVLPNWLQGSRAPRSRARNAVGSGYLLGPRLSAPIDAGMTLADGRRVPGDHNTWRGLIAATLTCAMAGALLGCSIGLGIAFATLALAADAASSLIKRRQRLEPDAESWGSIRFPRR